MAIQVQLTEYGPPGSNISGECHVLVSTVVWLDVRVVYEGATPVTVTRVHCVQGETHYIYMVRETPAQIFALMAA